MKQLGGLAGRMPITRAAATIASAAIAGVPPFSGFWSKLILVIAAVGAGYYWVAAIIVFVALCTLIMYLKVQRYVFLGQLPDNLAKIREQKGTMAVAMVFLACLCVLMGLLLIPCLRVNILEPAVKVLTDGVSYAANVMDLIKESGKV
jgi:multicomponent Na+:H+ antiporter subunit D